MKLRLASAGLAAAVAATGITLGLTASPAYASGAPGEVKIGGLCLDARNSGPYDGAPVQLYPCNGTQAQYWYEMMYATGLNTKVQLVNKASGRCLDIPDNNARSGQELQVWTCNRSDAQRFRFEGGNPDLAGGWRTLVNDTSHLVLDAPGALWHSGARPYLHPRNGTGAQRWYFTPGEEYGSGGDPCGPRPSVC
ncbi:RICIN domain-containing protein [Streptomyces sp. NPDC051567]|uniref:RICIN domain-containing protein n=1 Tax=Streptomyces sp. NPDC051567 TaxID=3365660 RepID=UPI00378F1E90